MKLTKVKEPWEHFLFEDVLDKNNFNSLLEYPELDSDYSNVDGLKRESVENRVFINDKFVDDNPQFKGTKKYFNSKPGSNSRQNSNNKHVDVEMQATTEKDVFQTS